MGRSDSILVREHGLRHGTTSLRAVRVVARGDADEHIVGGGEVLDDGALESRPIQCYPRRLDLHRLRVADLDQGAVGEVELQTAKCEQEDA